MKGASKFPVQRGSGGREGKQRDWPMGSVMDQPSLPVIAHYSMHKKNATAPGPADGVFFSLLFFLIYCILNWCLFLKGGKTLIDDSE